MWVGMVEVILIVKISPSTSEMLVLVTNLSQVSVPPEGNFKNGKYVYLIVIIHELVYKLYHFPSKGLQNMGIE